MSFCKIISQRDFLGYDLKTLRFTCDNEFYFGSLLSCNFDYNPSLLYMNTWAILTILEMIKIRFKAKETSSNRDEFIQMMTRHFMFAILVVDFIQFPDIMLHADMLNIIVDQLEDDSVKLYDHNQVSLIIERAFQNYASQICDLVLQALVLQTSGLIELLSRKRVGLSKDNLELQDSDDVSEYKNALINFITIMNNNKMRKRLRLHYNNPSTVTSISHEDSIFGLTFFGNVLPMVSINILRISGNYTSLGERCSLKDMKSIDERSKFMIDTYAMKLNQLTHDVKAVNYMQELRQQIDEVSIFLDEVNLPRGKHILNSILAATNRNICSNNLTKLQNSSNVTDSSIYIPYSVHAITSGRVVKNILEKCNKLNAKLNELTKIDELVDYLHSRLRLKTDTLMRNKIPFSIPREEIRFPVTSINATVIEENEIRDLDFIISLFDSYDSIRFVVTYNNSLADYTYRPIYSLYWSSIYDADE